MFVTTWEMFCQPAAHMSVCVLLLQVFYSRLTKRWWRMLHRDIKLCPAHTQVHGTVKWQGLPSQISGDVAQGWALSNRSNWSSGYSVLSHTHTHAHARASCLHWLMIAKWTLNYTVISHLQLFVCSWVILCCHSRAKWKSNRSILKIILARIQMKF